MRGMIDRPLYRNLQIKDRKVTLCGSTRFRDQFDFWNTHLTLAGNVVYSVAVDAHAASPAAEPTKAEKTLLDSVHLRKIDNSDAIFVIDVDGYVGESTAREIEYARAQKKTVYLLSEVCPELAFRKRSA